MDMYMSGGKLVYLGNGMAGRMTANGPAEIGIQRLGNLRLAGVIIAD